MTISHAGHPSGTDVLTEEFYSSLEGCRGISNFLMNLKHGLDETAVTYDRQRLNRAIRANLKRGAEHHDAQVNARIQCENKGHDMQFRSQEAWDEGYDEPMYCCNCGAWNM
jgi:hypothetical protein